MNSLRGKVAVITGASAGIGAGIAKCLAGYGVRLSLGGRKKNNLENVANTCGLGDKDILVTVGDVVNPDDRKSLIDRTAHKFGRLDILVNNAGVIYTSPLSEATEQQYDDTFNVNLKSVVFLTKLAIPHLEEHKGSIINISSTGSDMLVPSEGLYSMSKLALDAYTKMLAAELGPRGIRVNSINPGFVPTSIYASGSGAMDDAEMESWRQMTPLRKFGTPDDMGQIAAFLASDMAKFVTGEILFADGGLRMGKKIA